MTNITAYITEGDKITATITNGGATTFLGLTDVPAAYTGESGNSVRVNSAEDGLEYFTPSAGVSTFIGLTDTPIAFTGESLKAVRVNAGETALEFYTPSTGGEVNTASNLGSGTNVFASKVGVDLQYKSFTGGKNISITASSTEIEIAVDVISEIEDSAGTTGIYTESTADTIDIVSANTGTDYIIQGFEGSGTPVPAFQVDGNGTLYNNSIPYFQKISTATYIIGHNTLLTGTGNNNIILGNGGDNFTTGSSNTLLGNACANKLTSGSYNLLGGFQAGVNLNAGSYNVFLGNTAGYQTSGGNNNVYIGRASGYDCANKSGNVRIGYYSGRYTNTSNQLFINNRDLTDTATELTDSLIVGLFDTTVSNQWLRINGNLELTQVKSGATQIASGAAVNEVWKTASHATLPDNVLMIGV